jgi:hypothetical protein
MAAFRETCAFRSHLSRFGLLGAFAHRPEEIREQM